MHTPANMEKQATVSASEVHDFEENALQSQLPVL